MFISFSYLLFLSKAKITETHETKCRRKCLRNVNPTHKSAWDIPSRKSSSSTTARPKILLLLAREKKTYFWDAKDHLSSSLLVFSNADNILAFAGGDQPVAGEFADNLAWRVAHLLLDQFVAVSCNERLTIDTVHSFLLELLAELELESLVLESCRGLDNKSSVIVDRNLDGWLCCVGQFTSGKANVCLTRMSNRIDKKSEREG